MKDALFYMLAVSVNFSKKMHCFLVEYMCFAVFSLTMFFALSIIATLLSLTFFFFTFEISHLHAFGLGFISSLPQFIWD
jgi:hypothetical protein